jgi:hypothetical protein
VASTDCRVGGRVERISRVLDAGFVEAAHLGVEPGGEGDEWESECRAARLRRGEGAGCVAVQAQGREDVFVCGFGGAPGAVRTLSSSAKASVAYSAARLTPGSGCSSPPPAQSPRRVRHGTCGLAPLERLETVAAELVLAACDQPPGRRVLARPLWSRWPPTRRPRHRSGRAADRHWRLSRASGPGRTGSSPAASAAPTPAVPRPGPAAPRRRGHPAVQSPPRRALRSPPAPASAAVVAISAASVGPQPSRVALAGS